MATQIQFRRGTGSQHSGFTGVTGEVTVNTTNKSLHVHDGTTVGGFELSRTDLSNASGVGVLTATTFSGNLTGTATSTTNIPNLTGDVTSVNSVTTLATVNSNVGTFGSGGAIPSITVNAKGLITGVSTSAIVSGITVTDDTTTNATRYITFTSSTSGSISGEDISSTKLTFNPSTGTLGATNVNSTSDANLKKNIKTIDNAIDLVNKIRGVEFTWKENNNESLGVVAQEVEAVLPQLVLDTNGTKSVNYNGIIGVLIESIKDQQKQISSLEERLRVLEQ